VRVKRPKGIRVSANVLREAVVWKLNAPGFKDPPGFKIRIGWWQNPTRPDGTLTEMYRRQSDALFKKGKRNYGSQRERFETLRGALLSAGMEFKQVGARK
jgi:hypothetical protein